MKDTISKDEIQALDETWHKLIHIYQRTSDELWKEKLAGVTTIEISILNIIYRQPEVILKDITEMLGIPSSTLTNAVDRLEKRGLIKRAISKRDRRSFALELTEDGRIAQLEHKKAEKVMCHKILSVYDTKKERLELIRLLGKLTDKF